MAYFPFFVDIEGRRCLIVGGGVVACRKVEVLMDYGPDILVVSPEMAERMERDCEASKGKVRLLYREFAEEDLEGADFVVAATADEELNRRISALCRERRIPVNVVDVKDECSFIFPSLIKDGDITVGISSGGSSPTITQYLKKAFRAAIPEGFGGLARQLGGYRELVKSRVDSLPVRTEIFKEMVSEGIRQGGTFTREQAELLIERKLREAESKAGKDKEKGKEKGKEADDNAQQLP